MTLPIPTDDITVVTAPDFAEPRGGSTLLILGGVDLDAAPILQEINRVWDVEDPLVVYVQPVITASDVSRAAALVHICGQAIVMLDPSNAYLSLLTSTIQSEMGVVVSPSAELNNVVAFLGLQATSRMDVAVAFAAGHLRNTPN
jgi:hypothetical protein